MEHDNYKLVCESVQVNEDRKMINRILGIAITVGTGGVAWPVYRILRATLDEGTKHCGVFAINTWRRVSCMLSVKIKVLQELLKEAKRQKNQKFVAKIESKIRKLKLKREKVLLKKTGGSERKPSKSISWI